MSSTFLPQHSTRRQRHREKRSILSNAHYLHQASRLVFRFDEPVVSRSITVTARWSGELALPDGAVQGSEDADDFVLKVGLVEEGDETLNWFQRRIAAD